MKRLWFVTAAFAMLSLFAVGCQTAPAVDGSAGTDQLVAAINGHLPEIATTVKIATRAALLSVDEVERPIARERVHQVAVVVRDALNQDKPDLNGVRSLVATELLKGGGEYADLIQIVFDGAQVVIEADLRNTYTNLSNDQRSAATLLLLRTATQAVVEATESPDLPGTQPSAVNLGRPRVPSPFDFRCV